MRFQQPGKNHKTQDKIRQYGLKSKHSSQILPVSIVAEKLTVRLHIFHYNKVDSEWLMSMGAPDLAVALDLDFLLSWSSESRWITFLMNWPSPWSVTRSGWVCKNFLSWSPQLDNRLGAHLMLAGRWPPICRRRWQSIQEDSQKAHQPSSIGRSGLAS